jgi:hypothetical protein
MRNAVLAVVVAAGLTLSASADAARFNVNNVDPPGQGFNDPTPAVPVGGNTGKTLGEQRRIAFAYALQIWGNTLESNVPIVVQGSFRPLFCDASSAVLGSAGTLQIFSDFKGAPLAGHWYHAALSNSLAGRDLTPGKNDPGYLLPPYNDDIIAQFNSGLGKAGCLTGPGWYYGLDNKAPTGASDFLNVFLHEVAHGLGFANFVTETDGSTVDGLPDVYMANTRDLATGKNWDSMSAAEIVTSAVNTSKVVWVGPAVTAAAPSTLSFGVKGIRLSGTMDREVEYGEAAFGPAPTPVNFNGQVVFINDGVGAAPPVVAPGTASTTSDGCEPFGGVAGKIALIDRSFCGFAVKVKNAQNAGATAVIIANTLGRGEAGMAGTDPTITIPSVLVSNANADRIRANLPGVLAQFFQDNTRLAGTSKDPISGASYVRLYAPSVVALGSSISHWDTVASPNLIMEPFINVDLKGATNLDLTPALMRDIGWQAVASTGNVSIWGCDTGVAKGSAGGTQLSSAVTSCAANTSNSGQFQACVVQAANDLVGAGYLTGTQKGTVSSCAAGNP